MKNRLLSLIFVFCFAIIIFSTAPGFTAEVSAAEPERSKVVQAAALSDELSAEKKVVSAIYINPHYADELTKEDLSAASADIPEPAAGAEYLTEKEDVAASIRETMENRKALLTVHYASSEEPSDDWLKEWLDMALAETDKPYQGDYIAWCYEECNMEGTILFDGLYYCDYSLSFTYYTTAAQELQVTQKVDQLLDSFGFTTLTSDYDKIKTIYQYICTNVDYDYDNLNNDAHKLKYTAYAALIDGKAVCQGYACLLYRLLMEEGITARFIPGLGNGESHGWNIARLDDKYYNLDATWDADWGNATENYSYFLKSPANFSGHTRDAEYNTAEFNALYPMSDSDAQAPQSAVPAIDGVLITGSTCTIKVTPGAYSYLNVLAASYDDSGKMTGIANEVLTGQSNGQKELSLAVDAEAAMVKIFMLNNSNVPVCLAYTAA